MSKSLLLERPVGDSQDNRTLYNYTTLLMALVTIMASGKGMAEQFLSTRETITQTQYYTYMQHDNIVKRVL